MYRIFGGCIVATLILTLAGACSDDDKDSKEDQGSQTQKDKGVEAGQKPDAALGPNSGALCTGSGKGNCPNVKDTCIQWTGSSKGMCLMKCTPDTSCPKPIEGPDYATDCAFRVYLGGTPTFVCGWYCKYQGKDYDCPNNKDYSCIAPNSSEPNVKFCVAK